MSSKSPLDLLPKGRIFITIERAEGLPSHFQSGNTKTRLLPLISVGIIDKTGKVKEQKKTEHKKYEKTINFEETFDFQSDDNSYGIKISCLHKKKVGKDKVIGSVIVDPIFVKKDSLTQGFEFKSRTEQSSDLGSVITTIYYRELDLQAKKEDALKKYGEPLKIKSFRLFVECCIEFDMDDRVAGHLFVSKRFIGFISESLKPVQLTVRREELEKIVFLHSEYDVVVSSPETTIKITKISAEDKKKLEETISRDVRRLKKAGSTLEQASTLPTQNKSMQLDDMVNLAQEIMTARNNKRSRSNERKRKKKDPELIARRRSKSLRNIKKPVEEEIIDQSVAIENLKRSSRKGSKSGDKSKRELRKKASAESGLKKSSRKSSKTGDDIPAEKEKEKKHRKDSRVQAAEEKKEKEEKKETKKEKKEKEEKSQKEEENQAEQTRELVIESLQDIKPENPPHLDEKDELIIEKPAAPVEAAVEKAEVEEIVTAPPVEANEETQRLLEQELKLKEKLRLQEREKVEIRNSEEGKLKDRILKSGSIIKTEELLERVINELEVAEAENPAPTGEPEPTKEPSEEVKPSTQPTEPQSEPEPQPQEEPREEAVPESIKEPEPVKQPEPEPEAAKGAAPEPVKEPEPEPVEEEEEEEEEKDPETLRRLAEEKRRRQEEFERQLMEEEERIEREAEEKAKEEQRKMQQFLEKQISALDEELEVQRKEEEKKREEILIKKQQDVVIKEEEKVQTLKEKRIRIEQERLEKYMNRKPTGPFQLGRSKTAATPAAITPSQRATSLASFPTTSPVPSAPLKIEIEKTQEEEDVIAIPKELSTLPVAQPVQEPVKPAPQPVVVKEEAKSVKELLKESEKPVEQPHCNPLAKNNILEMERLAREKQLREEQLIKERAERKAREAERREQIRLEKLEQLKKLQEEQSKAAAAAAAAANPTTNAPAQEASREIEIAAQPAAPAPVIEEHQTSAIKEKFLEAERLASEQKAREEQQKLDRAEKKRIFEQKHQTSLLEQQQASNSAISTESEQDKLRKEKEEKEMKLEEERLLRHLKGSRGANPLSKSIQKPTPLDRNFEAENAARQKQEAEKLAQQKKNEAENERKRFELERIENERREREERERAEREREERESQSRKQLTQEEAAPIPTELAAGIDTTTVTHFDNDEEEKNLRLEEERLLKYLKGSKGASASPFRKK